MYSSVSQLPTPPVGPDTDLLFATTLDQVRSFHQQLPILEGCASPACRVAGHGKCDRVRQRTGFDTDVPWVWGCQRTKDKGLHSSWQLGQRRRLAQATSTQGVLQPKACQGTPAVLHQQPPPHKAWCARAWCAAGPGASGGVSGAAWSGQAGACWVRPGQGVAAQGTPWGSGSCRIAACCLKQSLMGQKVAAGSERGMLQAKAPLGESAVPPGVDRRCVRPRVGRCGRLLFDRCDAFSLAPLYDVLEPASDGKEPGAGSPQVGGLAAMPRWHRLAVHAPAAASHVRRGALAAAPTQCADGREPDAGNPLRRRAVLSLSMHAGGQAAGGRHGEAAVEAAQPLRAAPGAAHPGAADPAGQRSAGDCPTGARSIGSARAAGRAAERPPTAGRPPLAEP